MTESKNFLKLSFISSTTSNTLGFTFKIFGSDTLGLTFKMFVSDTLGLTFKTFVLS